MVEHVGRAGGIVVGQEAGHRHGDRLSFLKMHGEHAFRCVLNEGGRGGAFIQHEAEQQSVGPSAREGRLPGGAVRRARQGAESRAGRERIGQVRQN